MSIHNTSRNENMSQTTSASVQLPLTFQNLAIHERNMPLVRPSLLRIQRWLADISDIRVQSPTGDTTNDWYPLTETDEVAAAIERAFGGAET
jgi:hypothetical protein